MNIDNVDLTKKLYLLTGENDKILTEAKEALLRKIQGLREYYVRCDELHPSEVPGELWECMTACNSKDNPVIIGTHSPVVGKALSLAIITSNLRKEVNNDKIFKCILRRSGIKVPFEALIPADQIGVYHIFEHGIINHNDDTSDNIGLTLNHFINAERDLDSQISVLFQWMDDVVYGSDED